MQTVVFGKTGYRVSRLGLGAMRLPQREDGSVDFDASTTIIRHAFDRGVNVFDTHHFYHNSQSEEALGRALEGIPRDRYVIQTKIGMYSNYSEDECRRQLETALKRLRTDHIDIYLSHSLGWGVHEKTGETFRRFTDRAICEGRVRFRGFSTHDGIENVLRLIDTGEFSAMLVQYNLLNRGYEEAIRHAHAKGLAVSVMGPVGGGLLGSPEEDLLRWAGAKTSRTAALALKFVLARPEVHVAFSGMSTTSQVDENVETASEPAGLQSVDIQALEALFNEKKKVLDLYCTGCGYCMPCPHSVEISGIFRLYNQARVYGLRNRAREAYSRLKPEARVSSCTECGECESKCPQRIAIPERLKEAREHLED